MNKTSNKCRDLSSHQNRVALAKMVLKLFELWSLEPEEQLKLLGYKRASKYSFSRLQNGAPIPSSEETLKRIGKLLSIHKALRIIYPHNRDLCYLWVKRRNRAFGDKTPLEIMLDGSEGLDLVCRYLQYLLLR